MERPDIATHAVHFTESFKDLVAILDTKCLEPRSWSGFLPAKLNPDAAELKSACLGELTEWSVVPLSKRHGSWGVVLPIEILSRRGGSRVLHLHRESAGACMLFDALENPEITRDFQHPLWKLAPFLDVPSATFQFGWEREWRIPGGLVFDRDDVVKVIHVLPAGALGDPEHLSWNLLLQLHYSDSRPSEIEVWPSDGTDPFTYEMDDPWGSDDACMKALEVIGREFLEIEEGHAQEAQEFGVGLHASSTSSESIGAIGILDLLEVRWGRLDSSTREQFVIDADVLAMVSHRFDRTTISDAVEAHGASLLTADVRAHCEWVQAGRHPGQQICTCPTGSESRESCNFIVADGPDSGARDLGTLSPTYVARCSCGGWSDRRGGSRENLRALWVTEHIETQH